MYIIGDIGNTDVKICLFSKNKKLVKKIILKTNLINSKYLKRNLSFFFKKNRKYSSYKESDRHAALTSRTTTSTCT